MSEACTGSVTTSESCSYATSTSITADESSTTYSDLPEIDIYGAMKLTVIEEVAKKIKLYMSAPRSRSTSVSIEIAKATLPWFSQIVSVFGEKWQESIVIVSDTKLDLGVVRIIFRQSVFSGAAGHPVTKNFKLIDTSRYVNVELLKNTVLVNDPHFLIMSYNTFNILSKHPEAYEDIDGYNGVSGSAVYKSYRKVPIAITEFVEAGHIIYV